MILSAVTLLVPDYDDGIRFFCALGFRLTEDVDQGTKRWVTVEPPGGGCRLVLAVGAQNVLGNQAGGNPAGGRVWLVLRSDDFARDAGLIAAAGGVFQEVPRDEPYGRVAVWRDPWGNLWDLIGPKVEDPVTGAET